MRLLAVTSDFDTCECCGRTGLKRTAVCENVETKETVILGLTCAAKRLAGQGKASQGAKVVSVASSLASSAYDATRAEYSAKLNRGRPYTAVLALAVKDVYILGNRAGICFDETETEALAKANLMPHGNFDTVPEWTKPR